ncbi:MULTISPECIES: thioredoxin fold domain-containing protein [unclassified Neptuniibacter]|uniref:thioredoxin fold domain-containing protein n=1 Tax=unclassified Neptuniibacter TaxID=2630693 RepID=UPI000C42E54A|nr:MULTISPECIES: thioredoxin fold domain-containing protein [unclassified Neptuniibacter]MAY43052.1 protein-disulfide isomerase [Oceanospirillaceae bacterium]|tara:strand:- start:12712 stop:13464 length:753 start_codon:yes stop_codon:yes gene_type:complete
MKKILSAAVLLITCFATTSYANDEAKAFVDELLPAHLKSKTAVETPVSGLYEVVLSNGDILYVDPKSKSFLSGQLMSFSEEAGVINLTQQKKQELSSLKNTERKAALADIDAKDKVTYSPEGEVKGRIHVFTDISCGYCRRLHQEMSELNKLGIEVSYLAFPRAGNGSAAHKQMNAIWCAGNDQERRDAMDQAKLSGGIKGSDCKTSVIEQMELGQNLGVRGTPAMILESGELMPGYRPAKELAKVLGIK